MMGKMFLCFVVVSIVVTNAFTPVTPSVQRKVSVKMQSQDNDLSLKWGRALAILSLTAGLYSSPALAAPAPAPPASVLKSVLNDYKEKSVIDPAATITPVVAPPVVKKAPVVVIKKVTPPPAAKKVETPAPAPAPAPVVYKIKQDTELLKKLAATKKGGLSGSAEVAKEKVVVKTPVVVKAPVVAKTVEKVPEKVVPAPVQAAKPAPPPAVAKPVTVKQVVKAPIVREVALPEEKALVEAYNKKSGTKSKLDQLTVNVKSSKLKLTQARSDMKKYESKMEAFDKKLSKGGLDKDLRRSLSTDRKEEEKQFNAAKNVLRTSENEIERDTSEIGNLEKSLKLDDKLVDSKKSVLKKREEEIVKENKVLADKKVKAAADAKAAALAKEVKAGEGVVAKAQAELEASINAKKLTQLKTAEIKNQVKAEKEVLKKSAENVKSIMKVLEKGKEQEAAEVKKIADLTGKVAFSEIAESKAQDTIKSMEALVAEAKAKLSVTMKGK